MVHVATNVEDSSTAKQTVNDNLELEEFDKILGRNTDGDKYIKIIQAYQN